MHYSPSVSLVDSSFSKCVRALAMLTSVVAAAERINHIFRKSLHITTHSHTDGRVVEHSHDVCGVGEAVDVAGKLLVAHLHGLELRRALSGKSRERWFVRQRMT